MTPRLLRSSSALRLALLCCLLAGLSVLGGCASPEKDKAKSKAKDKAKQSARQPPNAPPTGNAVVLAEVGRGPAGAQDEAKKEKAPPSAPRKIIYTGHIDIIVGDFDKADGRLHELIRKHDGYVASSEVRRVPNEPGHGSWTVRIPVGNSDDFRESLRELGALHRSKLDSSDITDQYYDTQADQANLEAREKALRGLYDKTIANAKLADLLEVDRELGKVRGEINTLKGRLQRWDKEVTYATYSITIEERLGYKEPTALGFGETASDTFSRSLNAIVVFLRGVVLVLVAVSPWLVLFAAVGVPIWLVVRRFQKPAVSPPSPRPGPAPPAAPPQG
jgi:hypothetical protein